MRKGKLGLSLLASCLTIILLILMGCQQPPATNTESPVTLLAKVDLLGSAHSLELDSKGQILADATFTTPDGNVALTFDKGTKLLDKNGHPLLSLSMRTEPEIKPPEDASIVSEVYILVPQDAKFDRSIKLGLTYDSKAIPSGVSEEDVYINSYNPGNGWGTSYYKLVDAPNNRVTTRINEFAMFAVLAPLVPKPQNTQTASTLSMPLQEALTNGMPTLAELGSSTCIPCKQMKPILEALAVQFDGKINVVIVDVYEKQALAQMFGIMAIPTQIIFDKNGKELTRHMGVWSKEEIIAQFSKFGLN